MRRMRMVARMEGYSLLDGMFVAGVNSDVSVGSETYGKLFAVGEMTPPGET